jgi:transcriptional regulator with XRE-family HTH domain
LRFFRDLLRKQRQDLIDNASMTIDHLRDGEAEADPNDRATIEEENSLELRIRDRERKMLPRVEAALASASTTAVRLLRGDRRTDRPASPAGAPDHDRIRSRRRSATSRARASRENSPAPQPRRERTMAAPPPQSARRPPRNAHEKPVPAVIEPGPIPAWWTRCGPWPARCSTCGAATVGAAATCRPPPASPARCVPGKPMEAAADVLKAMLPSLSEPGVWIRTGAALRRMRKAAGLTITEVGTAINLKDPSLIEAWENGRIAVPFELVLRLAAVLGRNDPIGFVMKFTRSSNPDLWRALEALGVGKLLIQSAREREFANIYRADDEARKLSDEEFAEVLTFTRAAFEMAMAVSRPQFKARRLKRPRARRRFFASDAGSADLYLPRLARTASRCVHSISAPSRMRGVWRWIRSGGTKYRLPDDHGPAWCQRRQSSSHSGRASPMPLATMASGLAAMTPPRFTVGASTGSCANTLRPPHRRMASLMICLPLTVISGCFQIW